MPLYFLDVSSPFDTPDSGGIYPTLSKGLICSFLVTSVLLFAYRISNVDLAMSPWYVPALMSVFLKPEAFELHSPSVPSVEYSDLLHGCTVVTKVGLS